MACEAARRTGQGSRYPGAAFWAAIESAIKVTSNSRSEGTGFCDNALTHPMPSWTEEEQPVINGIMKKI